MIKPGVQLYGIKPEMGPIDNIIRFIFMKYDYGCVITSALDSHEGKISFHNLGWALDYRTKHIKNDVIKRQIVEDCKKALPNCDVGLHAEGTDNEHLHSEFDPKDDIEFQRNKKIWKRTGQWPKD